ncbi:MAG: hypothetical protein IKV03_06600 [Alphaproteobacteria bacterium]|nr:hypothetical protein [Alphaproteobacteria bacterium]
MVTKNQSGRSMVEIIGVLSIAGVLSIGGITGYSYAMNKYRANQAIHEITLCTIDLMTQLSQGIELSLGEWEQENTIYEFGDPIYTDDDLIKLDVGTTNNPIPKDVCEMIYEGMKSNSLYIDINGKEMDVNPVCDTNNTMTFYFEGKGSQMDICRPACAEDEYCDNGWCFKGDGLIDNTVIGDMCSLDTDCGRCGACMDGICQLAVQNGVACNLSNGNVGLCFNGDCREPSCTYDTNPCTKKDEYCFFNTDSAKTGICIPIDFILYEIDEKNYYISSQTLSYRNALEACNTINKSLLALDELVVGFEDDASITGDTTDLDYSGEYGRTDLATKLNEKINSRAIWTADTTYWHSDQVWTVKLNNGYVKDIFKRDPRIAVCH